MSSWIVPGRLFAVRRPKSGSGSGPDWCCCSMRIHNEIMWTSDAKSACPTRPCGSGGNAGVRVSSPSKTNRGRVGQRSFLPADIAEVEVERITGLNSKAARTFCHAVGGMRCGSLWQLPVDRMPWSYHLSRGANSDRFVPIPADNFDSELVRDGSDDGDILTGMIPLLTERQLFATALAFHCSSPFCHEQLIERATALFDNCQPTRTITGRRRAGSANFRPA